MRRTRRNCDCGESCFYCGDPVRRGMHEHDHFPMPWRYGGRETVPACRGCHTSKDRSLEWMSPAAMDAACRGLSKRAGFVLAAVTVALRDGTECFGDAPDTAQVVRELVESCTTAEARIAMAAVLMSALDHDERLGSLAEVAAASEEVA